MKLSQFQIDALTALDETEDNLILGAVAGSGKTTMLELMTKQIKVNNSDASILYLAFNNEICSDVAPKLEPYGVTVKTFHKFGNAAIRSRIGKYRIDQYKYRNMIEQSGVDFEPLYPSQITKLVEILRLWWVKVTPDSVFDALEHCNFDLDEDWINTNLENLTACIRQWILEGLKNTQKVDFVDMLVMPVANKYSFQKFDYVLIDECQDLSPIMQQIVKICMNNGSRIIAVGDRQQAINGFAGADLDSFDNLIKMTNAVELPLSVCYRCPDEVISLASEYVPHIQGTGKQGKVEHDLAMGDFINGVQAGDLVICRRNAPLLKTAFRLLANGHKVVIKGRSFADYILYYVKAVKKENSSFDQFLTTLDSIISKRLEKTKSDDRKELLNDVYSCLETLIDESDVQDFKGLTDLVNRIFDETSKDKVITLSSFHRSKGLQNPKVFILVDKKLAIPGNGQESNLVYVAMTRALEALTFVNMKDAA